MNKTTEQLAQEHELALKSARLLNLDFEDEKSYVSYRPDDCDWPTTWQPCVDLSQAWELYTHVFHYDDSSDVVFDTVNRLFGCAVQHEGQVSPLWLSPEEFARALTEESVK